MAFFKPEEKERMRSTAVKALGAGAAVALFLAPIAVVLGIGKAIGNIFSK